MYAAKYFVQFVIFQNKKKLMTETKSITRFIFIRKVLRSIEPKFVCITNKTESCGACFYQKSVTFGRA